MLCNVPEPEGIVAEAARLVRPGGRVVFHEADWTALACDPPLEAWDRLIDLVREYSQLAGIDLFIGRRLPRLLRDAGFVDVRSRALAYIDEPGDPRQRILSTFVDSLGDRLTAHGLIERDELDHLQAELARHLEEPDTVVVSHLFIQAWGRKQGLHRGRNLDR